MIRKTRQGEDRSPGGRITLLVTLLAWGCGSAPAPPQAPQRPFESDLIAFSATPEVAEIAQLEYLRSTGGGRLQSLLSAGTPEVRRRAALALGRLPHPQFGSEVTDALVLALGDSDAKVRRTAAFSLGQRGDPLAGDVLAGLIADPDPLLRARVAEASRDLDVPRLRTSALLALRDTNPDVRIAAILAMARWNAQGEDAAEVDRALVDVLLPSNRPGTEVDVELRWRILYSLQRRSSKLGRGAFLAFASSDLPLERLFAVRGLSKLPSDDEVLGALVIAANDRDWRVAVEAVTGLGEHAAPDTLQAVLVAGENRSAHVRRGACLALGNFDDPDRVVPLLLRGALDLSPSVQAAALVSLSRVLPSSAALTQLERHSDVDDGVIRTGVAEAAASLDEQDALPLLRRLIEDPDLAVAGAAIQSLASHNSPEVRALLHDLLQHSDNGLKLWAVLALREQPGDEDVGPLSKAISSAKGDIAPEIIFNALTNLGVIGGDDARSVVEAALSHSEPYVRRIATEVLRDSFGAAMTRATEPGAGPELEVPLPGREFPRWQRNPVIEIQTTRGSMLFELFPGEAPVHVHNFLSLADADHYDGLMFHRVVPDFVIQGGDYRGDGNGGQPWNGRAIPQEFTTRPYVRGSLGMPRNADPDSGGSQIFVTHRPTPHLDGRYTIFGELRGGGEVLDRIEVGDRILDVRQR